MGAAVPIVGAIITSVVVSKAVQAIGSKIGLPDDLTSLLSTVGGAVAGGYTYNAVSGAAAPPPNLAAATGATTVPAVSNIPGTPSAPSAPPVSNIPGTPLAPAGSPYASAPSAGATRGGLLSMPETAPPIPSAQTAPPPQAGVGGDSTAQRMIKSQTVGDTPPVEQSWMERLFSPEKTMDLAMAGLQGYGKAGLLQEKLEYPEKIAERNAAGWAAAYPGQLSLKPPQFPSQGGG